MKLIAILSLLLLLSSGSIATTVFWDLGYGMEKDELVEMDFQLERKPRMDQAATHLKYYNVTKWHKDLFLPEPNSMSIYMKDEKRNRAPYLESISAFFDPESFDKLKSKLTQLFGAPEGDDDYPQWYPKSFDSFSDFGAGGFITLKKWSAKELSPGSDEMCSLYINYVLY